jgi:hypothetical protein
VRQKYNDALSSYVTQYFGRPLEKLNVFFEGIQQLVSAGVKESEIGYQLAFSKQELRKVITLYPGKEVKNGLDKLYKKVERHLCEEEGLVQVDRVLIRVAKCGNPEPGHAFTFSFFFRSFGAPCRRSSSRSTRTSRT